MAANLYTVRKVKGLKPSSRRAIAFLFCQGNDEIDAGATFQGLMPKRVWEVRTRFDYWIDGVQPHNRWFHGWPNNPDYKHCFVFKWKEKRQHHRLYGFLYHPLPISNAGFQLCVLTYHATKNEWEADQRALDKVNVLRETPAVAAAITEIYPGGKGGKKRWVN